MSLNFRADQFEKEFSAHNLGNWEVSKWFPEKPCARKGYTKIISNDRGHILPGIKKTSPWGNYVGTWNLPKRITRELAEELNRPDPNKIRARNKLCMSENAEHTKEGSEKKLSHSRVEKPVDETPSRDIQEDGSPIEEPETQEPENLPKVAVHENRPYVPGDLTSPRHRHPSYEMLKNNLVEKVTLPNIHKTPSDRYSLSTEEERLPPEVNIAIHNFQTAKKFHQENLEHQPLPETITDPFYRKLQMQRHPHPGVALTIEPIVTGVGYKPYGGYSPTQCTKLKVYRPKTCAPSCSKQDRHQRHSRPNTTDKKRSVHTIIQKDITPIELALCWDVIPENPEDEPRRPVHIDGSNGSAAPAVFTKVHSPKPPEERKGETQRCHTQSFFEKVENPQCDPNDNCARNHFPTAKSAWCEKKDKDLCNHIKQMKISDNGLEEPVKIPDNMSHCSSKTGSKKCSKSSQGSRHSYKSADAVNHRILERQHQHSHSSPNLSVYGDKVKKFTKSYEKLTPEYKQLFCRPCPACEVKNWNKEKARPKSEYKMAFKAGKPNSNHSDTNSNGSHKPYLCIPKPRDPFVRKNYRITTLAPPFCLKPEKRDCEYPEHWRLASVYQHSYKPMQTRKRPLLASVYN